jgi:hypothetical protein
MWFVRVIGKQLTSSIVMRDWMIIRLTFDRRHPSERRMNRLMVLCCRQISFDCNYVYLRLEVNHHRVRYLHWDDCKQIVMRNHVRCHRFVHVWIDRAIPMVNERNTDQWVEQDDQRSDLIEVHTACRIWSFIDKTNETCKRFVSIDPYSR